MSKKKENKSKKQFKIKSRDLARAVWSVCVVLLILAMLISAGFAVVAIFAPNNSTQNTTISPEVLQQLQEQLNKQNVQVTVGAQQSVTVTP